MTIAALLQAQQQLRVALVDPDVETAKDWYPNFGLWGDEWYKATEGLNIPNIKDCLTNEWQTVSCYFEDETSAMNHQLPIIMTTPRSYVRIDKTKLRNILKNYLVDHNGTLISAQVISYDHHDDRTTVTLSDNYTIHCKIIIDATGFHSKFTQKESAVMHGRKHTLPFGYQTAYGFIATVNSLGPYSADSMTLFDYRYTSFTQFLLIFVYPFLCLSLP